MNSLQIKKRALIMGNSFKGYVREVSGTGVNSITLTNCMRQKPIGIDIYGSAEGVGDKTENLFDYDYYFENKTRNPSETVKNDYLIYTLEPNTQYTVSTNYPTRNNMTVFFAKSGVYLDNAPFTATDGIWDGQPRTITTDANGNMYIASRNNRSSITPPTKSEFSNGQYWIKIEKGSLATGYEPYGYKIPITYSNSMDNNYEPVTFNLYTPSQLGAGGGISLPEASTTNILMVDIINKQAIIADGYTEVQPIGASSSQRQYLNETDISNIQDWDSIEKLCKGTNIITVGTENTPSEINVKYYSSVKET